MENIKKFTTEELIEELTRRAVDADVVDSESHFCLLALKNMTASEKDSVGHKIKDVEESFINLEHFVESGESTGNAYLDKQFKKAYEFGIFYINGY